MTSSPDQVAQEVTKRLLTLAQGVILINVTPAKSVATLGVDTVTRLLKSAAEAFATKGFHGTTTRDIAQGAGLSPAGVYVHFGSKLEVLFHLSHRGHQQALALVREAAAAGSTPTRALALILERFTAWHVANFALARIVHHEFAHLSAAQRDELQRLRGQIEGEIQGVLLAGRTSGEFVVDDVSDTSLALLSLVVDVARWYAPGSGRDPDDVGRTNAALGMRLVGARADGPGEPRRLPVSSRAKRSAVRNRASRAADST